jgi:hypothetical protein
MRLGKYTFYAHIICYAPQKSKEQKTPFQAFQPSLLHIAVLLTLLVRKGYSTGVFLCPWLTICCI